MFTLANGKFSELTNTGLCRSKYCLVLFIENTINKSGLIRGEQIYLFIVIMLSDTMDAFIENSQSNLIESTNSTPLPWQPGNSNWVASIYSHIE